MAGEGWPIGENLGPSLGLAPGLLKAALKSLSRRFPLPLYPLRQCRRLSRKPLRVGKLGAWLTA